MRFLVQVRVRPDTLPEFGQKLQKGELDRSLIISETYCRKDDPAVGYSLWKAESRAEFDQVFKAWQAYYAETLVTEVIGPNEAMRLLMQK